MFIQKPPFLSLKSHLIAGLLLTLILICAQFVSGQAHAQFRTMTANQAVNLITPSLSYDVLEFAKIYEDEEGTLSPLAAQQRFTSGVESDIKAEKIVNLSYKSHLFYIVFELENNTDVQDWLLDFGGVAQGKSGLPYSFSLINATTGRTVFDTEAQASEAQVSTEKKGPYIPFRLVPGHKNIFVISIYPSDSMSMTFPLNVRAAGSSSFLSEEEFLSNAYFNLLLGGSIIFILGVCLFKGGYIFLPLIIMMGTKYFWFWLQDTFFILNLRLVEWAPAIYVAVSSIMAIIISYLFCSNRKRQEDSSILLIIMAVIVFFSFIMYAFILPQNTILRTVTLCIPYLLAFLSVAFYCFGQHAAGVHGAKYLGVTWLLWLSGIIIHYLATANFLPTTVWLIQAEWYVLAGIVVSMMLSVSGRYEGLKQEAVQLIIRKAQKAQSLAKLKQSKESADQARLLRVIEREREIMEELRQRETQRTEEMRQAKIAADEANSAKSAFLAVVSHEIRTPMTGIMGMVRLMHDTPLSNEQLDYVQTIKDSGDAMLALLNDILDFSKIESGGMQLEIVDFDLQRLLDGVVRLMSGHASQKNIFIRAEIAHDVPRYLKGDPTRLRQVLLNFVGNAIKFTSEGGVTIHVYIDPDFPALYERPNETPVKFVIEDTGIGISEDGQKKLFTPFAQADSSISRKFGGTGLGLAICKRLIEAMGSKIELKSVEGQGSKFFFTLAMDKGEGDAIVDEMASAQANQQKAAGVRLTILVVDDNEINRKVVQGILTKYGHKSVVAENGGDAVAMAEYNPFDLILMDIELPDMNGVEATKLIRNNPKIPKQPHIAALTGNVQQEAINYYIESGMDSHLAKPIEPQKIEQLLNFLAAQKGGGTPPAEGNAQADALPVQPQQGSAFDDAQDFNMGQGPQPSQAPQVPETRSEQEYQPALQEPSISSPMQEPLHAPTQNPEPQQYEQPNERTQVQDEVSQLSQPVLNEQQLSQEQPVQVNEPEAPHQPSAVEQAMQGEFIAEDKPADEAQGDIATDAKIAELFDEPMLAGLKDAMGFEQLNELMQPLFEKNDELVADLQAALESENWLVVKERGHEIKGMNGNFGLIKLQELGGKLEAMAREDVTDKGAYAVIINQLPKYKDESREVLESWMRK